MEESTATYDKRLRDKISEISEKYDNVMFCPKCGKLLTGLHEQSYCFRSYVIRLAEKQLRNELSKANKLMSDIKRLEDRVKCFKESIVFRFYAGDCDYTTKHLAILTDEDINTIRKIAMDSMEEQLKELKVEFENL